MLFNRISKSGSLSFLRRRSTNPIANRFFSIEIEAEEPSTSDSYVLNDYLNRPVSYPLNDVKVVLLENIHPRAKEIFANEGYKVETHTRALSGQELIEIAGDAHMLGIRSKTQLDSSFFESIGWHKHRLWGIGCFCIGTNQVDLTSAANTGIPVFNAPFSNTRSVAEKTLSEVIALHRKLFMRSMELHNGQWNKSASGAHEVRGTTLGIVGYGRIGSQVSVLAELLGMKVVFYDPIKCLPLGNARQVDSLSELLSISDAVTLHVPANPTTKNMINADILAKMKPGALLVNNARGSTVDIEALAEAMKIGHIGGCAIDVFPVEPEKNGLPFDTPLIGVPNAILTPHIGGSTEEAQENIAVEVATKLLRFMNDGSSTTATNIPEVELAKVGSNTMRILHMHHNVPGVLSKIHTVFSDFGINVNAQYLQSNQKHSYIILEVEPFHGETVKRELGKIKETIVLRTLL